MKLCIWFRSIHSFIRSLVYSYSETHSQIEETEGRQIMRAVEVYNGGERFCVRQVPATSVLYDGPRS